MTKNQEENKNEKLMTKKIKDSSITLSGVEKRKIIPYSKIRSNRRRKKFTTTLVSGLLPTSNRVNSRERMGVKKC